MKMLMLVTVLTLVGLLLVVYPSPSKHYWENVGPSWDRMLNPNKYSNEE